MYHVQEKKIRDFTRKIFSTLRITALEDNLQENLIYRS